MDSIENTKHTFFITDKNYILPKENESLKIQKYFDTSRKQIFSFTTQNDGLFLILNQKAFGSAFFGNTVLANPKYYIIKKFNPILLLIQIIYSDEKKDETKNKTSNSNFDFIDTNAIIQKYEDKLKSLKSSEIFNNINFDTIFKSSMNLVKDIFDKYSKNIEYIAEIKEIDDLEKKICVKKCESKIFNYLNSKVNNISEEEMEEIEKLKPKNEDEKKELMERINFEKFSILEPFIPNELTLKYKEYRFKNYVEEDEKSKKTDNSEKSANKRKHKEDKSNKRRNNKKEKGEKSKNQRGIDAYIKKNDKI